MTMYLAALLLLAMVLMFFGVKNQDSRLTKLAIGIFCIVIAAISWVVFVLIPSM